MTKILKINRAIRDIKDALSLKENPFFFIVGAGISAGSVPLAKDIINLCKEKTNEDSFVSNDLSGAEEYSNWLETAYPHASSRQKLFRELIENKNITPANFRLAHILSHSKLANIVVTPNFDDFLTRALNFFNVKHIVCDHPETAFKVNNENNDIHIVHVHGTYLSYDCCNLTPEIIERNKTSEVTTNTMASLLERLGETMSPIVVGYSGWEDDVIMTSLRKRLQGRRLPYNLYWFCYKESELETLPEWLKGHNNVVFVVPEKNDKISQNKSETILAIEDNQLKDKEPSDQNEQEDYILSAHVVFDRIVSSLNLPEPEITENPIDFLIKFLGGTNKDLHEPDVFFLGHVIDRLKKLKDLETKNEETNDQNLILFKNIRGFARRSQYNTAAQLLKGLEYKNLEKEVVDELVPVVVSIISNIDKEKDKEDELRIFGSTYLEDILLSRTEGKFFNHRIKLLPVIYGIQSDLFEKHNMEDKYLETLNKIIQLLTNVEDEELRFNLINAHYKKGRFLEKKNSDTRINEYKKVIELCKNIEDDKVNKFIFQCNNRLGIYYHGKDQFIEARKHFDEILMHPDKFSERKIAGVLFNKMLTYKNENNKEKTKSFIDQLDNDYKNSTDEIIQELIIKGFLNEMELLHYKESRSILLNKRIIEYFHDTEVENIKFPLAEAYRRRGYYHYDIGDTLTAASDFIRSLELNKKNNVGNNLFYMLRRKEIEQDLVPYTMEELLEFSLKLKDPFSLINKALYIIQKDSSNSAWEKANNLIAQINYTKNKKDLLGALNWWHNLSKNNDSEGDLVIAWLARHQLISDPDSLNLEERLEKIKDYRIPEFMYEHVYN